MKEQETKKPIADKPEENEKPATLEKQSEKKEKKVEKPISFQESSEKNKNQSDKIQEDTKDKEDSKDKKQEQAPKKDYFSIIRIKQTDIPGNKRVLTGLTYIKGISWSISNAICHKLKINANKKIAELDKKQIHQIEEFLKNPQLPAFLMNRKKDFETGEDSHLIGSDLEMKKGFDIRRLKKIRSYRGLRHAFGHPTRGQRTKSHFRSRGKKKTIGVQKKKIAPPKPKKG